MNKILAPIFAFITATAAWAGVTFDGSRLQVIPITPESSTGLNAVYVVPDFQGVTLKYTAASSSANVTWQRYSNLGGGYAEDVAVNRDGAVTSLALSGTSDMGYIITEGTSSTYLWVIDYAKHYLDLKALNIAEEQECDMAALTPVGTGDRILYYTINGQQKELSRELTLTYATQEFNEDNGEYQTVETTKSVAYLQETIHTAAPLCSTNFLLSGDRFLRQWGQEQSVESAEYSPIAVEAYTSATVEERKADNEKTVEGSQLGGSAPVVITFKAAVTEAAIFREWQFSEYPEFDDISLRFTDLEFAHTFNDAGTTYVRFMASNSAGSCDYYGDTYEVFVGESMLQCPNAFSPNGDGVNDEWKVSYKSIIDFECTIFNRWGQQLAHFTDPSQGWDGKAGGKVVPAGVYFYAIKAKGSDGKNYNLGGDINVIKYKEGTGSTTSGDGGSSSEE